MRRFTLVLGLTALVLPLAAAVPASKIKEPNAVFAYGISGTRVTAVLFDRAKRVSLDHLDARTNLPLQTGKSMGSNDTMQFSPATGRIYAVLSNINMEAGTRLNPKLPYDAAIVETNFDFKKPTIVFSCDACAIDHWIVHPSDPKLYVSLADAYREDADEFRDAKLIEVSLGEKRRTRTLSRIPSNAELRIAPDGKTLFTFGQARNSQTPYGEVVSVDLLSRKRTEKNVNLPSYDVFGLPLSPQASDLSPDAREIAYPMNIVDVRTGDTTKLIATTDYDLDNHYIGWSRDSQKLLFQLKKSGSADDRVEVPLVFERSGSKQWVLPLQDDNFLDWSPAQTAILFQKPEGIGFYDLQNREWVFVFDDKDGDGDASWITMPTKKVPRR